MKLFILLLIIKFNYLSANQQNEAINDYCSGYLGEVYGALDTIEDPIIRNNIEKFFDQNFQNTELLNYDLYYDSSKYKFTIIDNNKILS